MRCDADSASRRASALATSAAAICAIVARLVACSSARRQPPRPAPALLRYIDAAPYRAVARALHGPRLSRRKAFSACRRSLAWRCSASASTTSWSRYRSSCAARLCCAVTSKSGESWLGRGERGGVRRVPLLLGRARVGKRQLRIHRLLFQATRTRAARRRGGQAGQPGLTDRASDTHDDERTVRDTRGCAPGLPRVGAAPP